MLKYIRNLLFIALLFAFQPMVFSQNAIVTENALPGNPPSEWDITGAGDLSIQGFATAIGTNKGNLVSFKITTTAGISFGIKVYRLGYYNGSGARLVADLGSTFTGINQSPCVTNITTGEVDCGNWTAQASWNIPTTAVSGVYIARIRRNDNGGASHIIFIVRDDAANAPILFKTSDATWQAYNDYGGNNLYAGTVAAYTQGHATKVSYNRPFYNRKGVFPNTGIAGLTGLFNAEYAMIRWMERNGYNLSYTTCVDMARDPSPITPSNHKILLSVGHDEYWSAEERSKFDAAANAGVSLAFFSGNEVYWKTRWENSIDGSATPYRTLVCYKEGDGERGCGGKCDPLPNVWTGQWRAGCDFPGNDGCKPENALSGQISWSGTWGSITVPAEYSKFRFWKNTRIATLAPGQSVTFPNETLGHEWDPESTPYASYYPARRITLSNTLVFGQVHKLSLYKRNSGALVFAAGTVQWSWGLDSKHDRGSNPPSPDMQQSTVNLFADMGVLPEKIQSGLVMPVMSTDQTAPLTTITAPANGTSFVINTPISISGTAMDAGGAVGGVEISFDGGASWQLAKGTENWTFSWTPQVAGNAIILVRSFDDSWNVTPVSGQSQLSITVIPVPVTEACVTNDSVVQFNAGNTGTDTRISPDGNGALIARPRDQQEFEGSTLPPGFSASSWSGSNTPQFGGGKVILNGVRIYSNVKYPTGTTIEFYAKFSDDNFENIGFAADGNFSGPWAVIGRDQIASKGYLYARSDNGGRELLGTNLTGQYHRYKITLNSDNVEFFVDGVLAATIVETVSNSVILVSDFNANTLDLSVDWLRILPYTVSGTYLSAVFDAGAFTRWNNIFWNAIQPAGTNLNISVRTGNTAAPDGTWSDYVAVTNGGSIDQISRYIQYKATLGSMDNKSTVVLQNILITCNSSFNLPVTDLKAFATNNDIKLDWTTNTEYNTKTFEIQKSLNGTDFVTIGYVDAAGNSTVHRNYTYTDKGLEAGTYYYRLKQIDIDNRFRYSNIVSAEVASVTNYRLEQNYPNPFSGKTTIDYAVPKTTPVSLSIFDMQGRLVLFVDEGTKNKGRYSVEIHTGTLNHGVYYYRMQAQDFSTTRKMFVR